ncbi:MAG TPA: protein kinase [Vicinamibacterales bacterium]|nr:protein kinase [Vicinamibacterales bacterium]
MALSSGTRIGPYVVQALLGQGGMGEVYRARDVRLNRDVAVKVLPPAFANDPDRRARFEREAQAIATLSHPNVLNIFDTGVDQAQLYVVTELLQGETLRERLSQGALTIRKALDYAVQIARGLGAAHDKGLVHRDLKPENVFLLEDGQLKILDFGLARASVPAGTAAVSGAAGETIAALTDAGTVMGTVGYMAPEQIKGDPVDARADLFALGAVFYEMVTGRRAFQRDTSAETMTAILRDDPPELAAVRGEIPPAVDRILRHCLEKNPRERFQTARDVAFALEALSGSNISTSAGTAIAVAPRRRWVWPAVATLSIAAAAAAGAIVDRRLSPPPSSLSFERKSWDPMWVTNARFGPDGQTIVFSAAKTGNVPELFAIRPGSVIPQTLGQPATHLLSVSSKGELAVLTGARFLHHRLFTGTLSRMTLDGAPRQWMEDVREADWAPDGASVAVIHHLGNQDRLEYPSGTVRYSVSGYLSDLRVSPDGSQVAFFEHQTAGDDRGWVKLLTSSGAIKQLAGEYWGEEGLAWSADGGSVLFSASESGVEQQPLIVNVTGRPVVRQRIASADAMVLLDVAADGRMLIVRNNLRFSMRALLPGQTGERELSWLDFPQNGILSADRRLMAFTDLSQNAGPNYAVAIRDMATDRVVRLGEGYSWGPSPDGRWVGAQSPSTSEIYLYPTGAGQPRHIDRQPIRDLTGDPPYPAAPQWMPDGKQLLMCGAESGKQARCYVLPIAGGTPQPVTPEGIRAAWPAPDGRTLLVHGTAGYEVLTIGSAAHSPARGFEAADAVIGWNDDRSIAVSANNGVPARIDRVDIETGARTHLRDISPPDNGGVYELMVTQWTDGGRSYVYHFGRTLDVIFVVKETR